MNGTSDVPSPPTNTGQQVAGIIAMTSPTADGQGRNVHAMIRRMLRYKATPGQIDDALRRCPDPECMECGRLICPHGEPLHFHHDGCPACDSAPPTSGEGA